ncbi:immunity 49 family protein [Streptomyces sp. NPDC020681]|uniref:immunity 49 family protein n=1 Tax=Streptomyces sp. NPDC020681 TaxID=3365083 RepID=UPI0037AEA348
MSLTLANWACLTDPAVGEFATWETWVTAMQVGSGLFISGAAESGPTPSRVGTKGEIKNLPATGPQDYLHAGNWLTAYYLAVICRENERLDQLARIPVSFLRASGAEIDECLYAWVETLQNAWFSRPETWDTLAAAIDGTDPEAPHIADAELMLNILYPPMEVFHRYQLQEPEPFNSALEKAVTWHREYWSGDEARAVSGAGLVALGPLAIACMAFDADIPVEVESEYLPRYLVERRWVGQAAT